MATKGIEVQVNMNEGYERSNNYLSYMYVLDTLIYFAHKQEEMKLPIPALHSMIIFLGSAQVWHRFSVPAYDYFYRCGVVESKSGIHHIRSDWCTIGTCRVTQVMMGVTLPGATGG